MIIEEERNIITDITEEQIHEYYKALAQLKDNIYNYINCEEIIIDGKHCIFPTKCKKVKVNGENYMLPKRRINYGN